MEGMIFILVRIPKKSLPIDIDIQAKIYRICNHKDIAIQGGPGNGPLCGLWFASVSEGLKKGEGVRPYRHPLQNRPTGAKPGWEQRGRPGLP